MEPPPRIEAKEAPVAHAVNFAPGATALTETEAGALAAFLATEEVSPGERIMIQAPSGGAAETQRLAQRTAAIRSELENQGVATVVSPPAAPGTLGADQIRVIATRPTIVDPDCPGYNQPIEFDRFSRPNVRMGCSTEMNLGLMVADPNDLVRGRPLDPADAERSTLAVQKYRSGSEGKDDSSSSSSVSFVPLAIGTPGGGGN
jgi:pilus assembly protein CpaD